MLTKKSIVVFIFTVLSLALVACRPGSPPPELGQPPDGQAQPANQQPAGEAPPAPEQAQKPNEQPADNAPAQPPGAAQQPPPDAPPDQGGPQNPPDLAAAAKTLGITEQELMDALGPPPPDFAAAAQTLSITEQELQNALFAAGAGSGGQAGQPPANSGSETTTAPVQQAPVTSGQATAGGYPLVDTSQTACYSDQNAISCPQAGAAYYGQDALYAGNQASYSLSADGLTVYDNVTGLTWMQSPDLNGDGTINVNDKLTFADAQTYADAVLNPQNYGGYNDWRLPTIKELYSLMDFRGTDPSGPDTSGLIPFIDTNYFDFGYGDEAAGERVIDAQFWSSNAYLGTVFGNQTCTFGLNLADGRIKCYPSGTSGPSAKLNYVYFVRGNTAYGVNNFTDNRDGTVTDNATGLMWSQDDSGTGMNWADALAWVQQKNAENYLGYSDWRLPNAKEMQSLVDYSRAPDATNSAAIDPVFNITQITNEAGQVDYPWFWTGTTHLKSNGSGFAGVYISFGRALGYMYNTWLDVHGAGAQRSDPKSGDPADYPTGHGPQGDAIRIYNYVRLVRGGAQFVEGAGSGADASIQPQTNNQPTGANGQPPAGGSPPQAGDGPPQEAINACSGLSANAACQFTTPHGEIRGTCLAIAEQLACVPEGGPPSQ
jgi:hypothetical protein